MNLSELKLERIEQPDSIEFSLADDIFVKSGLFKKSFSVIPQHSHEYDHTSFIAYGAVRAWCEEKYLGTFYAPTSLFIKKNCKHTFQTIEPDTLIYCMHNISRSGMVEVHDLHELTIP